MSDLKPCPFCKTAAGIVSFKGRFSPACDTWGCPGSFAESLETQVFATKAEAIAAWNRRASEWVSVEERLPEDGDCVLICHTREGHVGEARFAVGEAGYNPIFIFTDVEDAFKVASPPPTHWTPLPDPPEARA